MTSAAQRRANRLNAARSTGPRTEAGKARVARNALRHGFAMRINAFSELNASIAHLARVLAGPGASEVRLGLAGLVAEARSICSV